MNAHPVAAALLLGVLAAACGSREAPRRCPECECDCSSARAAETRASASAATGLPSAASPSDSSRPAPDPGRIIASDPLPVDLPRAARGADEQAFFVIEVTKDGHLFVEGKSVPSMNEMAAQARRAFAANKELRATIRADASVPHGKVMEILDRLKQEGIGRIAFGVSPTTP